MRGAADSIGIAVNYYLQTQPAPEIVVNYHMNITNPARTVDAIVATFQRIQDLDRDKTANVEDCSKLQFVISLHKHSLYVEGTYMGSYKDFNDKITPEILRGLPDVPITAQGMNWIEVLKRLNQGMPLDITNPYTGHSNFYAKSLLLPESDMTVEALNRYFKFLLDGREVPISYYTLMSIYDVMDSRVGVEVSSTRRCLKARVFFWQYPKSANL